MGRTLLRANLRRKKRRRSLPCTRFCSCCCDGNSKTRNPTASSLRKKREAIKEQRSGRILKSTKKTSTSLFKVKPSNCRKPVRSKRVYQGRTDGVYSQLKKVIVNVKRLSEDVLNILSQFGSICACEVDSESVSCDSNSTCKFVKSPCLTTPVRRLRSTPIVPVDRHTPSSVMDKLRVLNADWRSSTYPVNDNPSFSSKTSENNPLAGISMKTLFLQNLSICQKAPNDESAKENVKIPPNGLRPGGNLQLPKDKKDTSTSAVDFKSSSKPPCKSLTTREPVATKISPSKLPLPSSPLKMQTSRSQSIWPHKQSTRPKILGAKPIIGERKSLGPKNTQNRTCLPLLGKYTSLIRGSTVQINNTNVRRKDASMMSTVTPSKTDLNVKGVVSEGSKRPNTADPRRDKPQGVDDSGSTSKKRKIQDSPVPCKGAIPTPRTNAVPAAKITPGKNQVYTIVLSDSSDDEDGYVLLNRVARKPPPKLVAKSNNKKAIPERKSSTKVSQDQTASRSSVSSCNQPSDERASKSTIRSNPKVPVKKPPATKKSTAKKKVRAKIQFSDSESDEYYSSDSKEATKLVEVPTKRVRGSWKGGCRSCPGCQIDAPRKQQPKQVLLKKKALPKRQSHSTDSDSSIEYIGTNLRNERHSPKPESPPTVILHGLTSSSDSLDDMQDEHVLGHGRTALVFKTEPPGSKVSKEKTLPAEKTLDNPIEAIPEQVLDVDKLDDIRRTASSSNIHDQTTSIPKPEETDLPKTNPPGDDPVNDGNLFFDSSNNVLGQQNRHETNQSVLEITDSSEENSTKFEIRQPDDLAVPCSKVDIASVSNVDSEVKDESREQQSRECNSSHIETSVHGIDSASPEEVELPPNIERPKSQCNEKCEDVSLVGEYPSCESLDSSIAIENLDCHDYSGSNCSSLSIHGDKCEGPTTSDHLTNVPDPSITPLSECGSTSPAAGAGNKDLGQACEESETICHRNVLLDNIAEQHISVTQQAVLEHNLELPCPAVGSPEASLKPAILSDVVAVDQNCEMSPGSDGVLGNTDQPKEPSSDIDHSMDDNCNDATNDEHQDTDVQAPAEHPSQEIISNELSHLLNDIVESVKLENREVIISKAHIKSSESMEHPAAATEPGSSEETASVAKELNLPVPLNSRLMIRKLPVSKVGNAAFSQDIHMSEDGAQVPEDPEDIEIDNDRPSLNEPPETHCQVPENPPSSAVTAPSRSSCDSKGYPSPIKRLNTGVLSIIKYSDMEIDNDEPSLNDPPETDLVECVSSKGVRFALNPDDLSSIEDLLNVRSPVDDKRETPSSSSTKEVDSKNTVDDFIIDNDAPPLNPSPFKRDKRPPPVPENEEDPEDFVIDNDAPSLNESAEAVTEVKPVSNDSDCLIISSDDEVCPLSAADPQLVIPEVKIPILPSRVRPRPKKKLLRMRRSSVVDSVRNSTNNHNLKSQLKLPWMETQECLRVGKLEALYISTSGVPGDDFVNEVAINDCGIQTMRQPAGKPLPPFQSSKNHLNVPVENLVEMSSFHNDASLCSRQEGPCRGIPQTGSTDQVIFDLDELDFLDGDILNEVVIDDSCSDSVSRSSSKPLPRIQESLLQPQVFDMQGLPLKLDQGHSRDPGSNYAGLGNTTCTSQYSFDLSETLPDDSTTECLNISDSDTHTASEGEGVAVSPPIQPRSTVNAIPLYESCFETKDLNHIAISDSDDDLIEVSADSSAQVSRTHHLKPLIVNPPPIDLRPPAATPKNFVLPAGAQVKAVPNGNGDFYYVIVVPPKQC